MTATRAAERAVVPIETGQRRFRWATRWITHASITEVIARSLTAATGRPRSQPWPAMLTLLALTALHGRGRLVLRDVERVAAGLTHAQRRDLGIGATTVTYAHVESALAALASAFEPAVDTRTGEVLADARIGMPLEDVCTQIVQASITQSVSQTPDLAIDSTDIETWARRRSWTPKEPDVDPGCLPEEWRPPKRMVNEPGWPRSGADGRNQHSVDPDARDGYRSGKNLAPKEVFLGYDLHLVVDVTPERAKPGVPPLIRGMALAPAGTLKSTPGLAAIDAVTHASRAPRKLCADRGYTYLKTGRWARPLCLRGIISVHDLHGNQRGVHPGPLPGAVFVDGGLFIDALPQRLRKLPSARLGMSAAERAQLCEQYDKRAPYAFTPFGRLNHKRGTQRYRGPALTGRVRCPNNPRSLRLPPHNRPTTTCTPGKACACGKTVTLGPGDYLNLRQPHLWGTTAWRLDYARRNNVESGNAALKTHHAQFARGSIRVLGTTKHSLLLAFILGSVNIAILDSRMPTMDETPGGASIEDTPISPSRTGRHAPRVEGRAPPGHT